jgi:ABC-type multidrug transport system ATPase subunit
MTSPILRTDQLNVRRGRRTVLADVSLRVERGQIVAILGPNGAGKSTLVEAVGGVLPHRGEVKVDGRVATVMQTPGLARRSVRANIDLALAWWGVPRRERRARCEEVLALMHAEHLLHRPASALSGGERRRVHVARGVALNPDLLLLDEPFAGLDPHTHAALAADTISALRDRAGSVLVVLHDRADAWAMADRIIVMFDGRIVADDSPERLLSHPPTADVARFLGYDGELTHGAQTLLTRAPDLLIDAAGELEGTVSRVVRLEDGARLEVVTPQGTVWTQSTTAAHTRGDSLRLRVVGGVSFTL